MSSKRSVAQKTIYSQDKPTDAEKNANVIYQPKGNLSNPELVNREIEDANVRAQIPVGQGKISVTIQPGDELGDISLNVQFEGTRGAYDFCLKNHNELLFHVSEWMKEFLENLDADFDITIESKPCPKTANRVELDLAAQILQGNKSLNEVLHAEKNKVENLNRIGVEKKNQTRLKS